MLIPILLGLAVAVVLFFIIVATRPSDFRVARSATINAPPATVFAHVNDLHVWQTWSPWAKRDPHAKITYEGPVSGTGAGFAWSGNNKIGEGRMRIIESRPYELVRFDLVFIKPFKGHNTADFTFKTMGNQTEVTWAMTGKNNLMGKAFGLFVNFDKMCGRDFEKGLAQMKVLAEAAGH